MYKGLLISFIAIFHLLSPTNLVAQNYTFYAAKGALPFAANASQLKSPDQIDETEIYQDHFYRFIQFNALPDANERKLIAANGIQLVEYIPNNVYLAIIPIDIDFSIWESLNIRGLMPVGYTFKTSQRIQDEDFPDWAVEGDHVLLSLRYFQNIPSERLTEELKERNIELIKSLDHGHIVVVKVLKAELPQLIETPFVRYVSFISEPGKAESEDGRHLHAANTIDGDYYGARDYDGTGVSMAVNDDGFAGPHIDFQGRANQDDVAGDLTGSHGDMTAGIAVGAGNLDPLVRGMATGAYVFIRQYDPIMPGTLPLHQDSGVLVFSSSYSNGCNGGYTNTTLLMDQEIYDNPSLMQVFSAGNSNNIDCGYGAGDQWGNVTGGHKIAKNVICTANLDNMDVISYSSSRGPASDGRIKPDISAHGVSHVSTYPDNQYAPGGGTSAACPGIAGVFAQLNQAYRELNSGAVAPSALLKLALLNTANELGNDGPDYIFGWGKVNALRCVDLLEEARYHHDSIDHGVVNTHTINIPAGVERARIMVYWADIEGSTSSATALVNNLDLKVSDPGSSVHLPWILDHTPNAATLGLPATTGIDSINNMEQVAIDNPAGGTYTLTVSGTSVPFGPQEYFIAWEFLINEVTVVHPQGGEGLIPGVSNRVHWDAYGELGPFTVEYTDDDGVSWNSIGTSSADSDRFMDWNVPNIITGEARVRVTRGSSVDESDANFTIVERPGNLHVIGVCNSTSTFHIAWDSVPGATEYEVFLLGDKYMDSIGTTSNRHFEIMVPDLNDNYWYSVRALGPNGIRSLRQIAKEYDNFGFCFVDCVFPDDAGIHSIDSPGSTLSACAGITEVPVTVTLENMGTVPQTNFSVSYQMDAGPVVTETYTGTLAGGATASYTFTTQLSLPAPGTYNFKSWTGLLSDSTSCNDTLAKDIIMLPIGSTTLAPYMEDFEGGVFPSAQAFVVNPDNGITWAEVNGIVGVTGGTTTAAYVNNYIYNVPGEEDYFYTMAIDLSSTWSAELTFDVAYREFSTSFTDQLRVDISVDCGTTYSQIYYKAGSVLATGASTFTNWIPDSTADWRNEQVDLVAYTGEEIVLRFVNITGYGNNIYIDNINVNVGSVGMEEPQDSFNWNIHPNPVQDQLIVSLDRLLSQDARIQIVSLDGKTILTDRLVAGNRTKALSIEGAAAGIYLVQIKTMHSTVAKRVVVVD